VCRPAGRLDAAAETCAVDAILRRSQLIGGMTGGGDAATPREGAVVDPALRAPSSPRSLQLSLPVMARRLGPHDA